MSSKKVLILFSTLLLFLTSSKIVNASVLINEISPSTTVEWVELYNDGTSEIDLAGYLLKDGNSSTTDDLILSGTISANGFLVFNHDEGWLNNSGDTLKLYNNASPSAVVDEYTYSSVDATKSVARMPNGSENWQITSNVTNNSSNPSPTPQPTATTTPQPTSPPTATTAPTARPTPTRTASARPTPTPTETSEPEETESPADNSVPSSTDKPTLLPTSMVAGDSTERKFPILAIIFVVLGIGCLGYVGYLLYNGKYAKP